MHVRSAHFIRSVSIFLPLLLAIFISCSTGTAVRSGEVFRLREGESRRAAGALVRFIEVASDSRCPQGVTCVWEGDADVRLTVDGHPVTLHNAGAERRRAAIDGRTIELVALAPQPEESSAKRPGYEVELRVTEGGSSGLRR
jgi:hypothetical protein